MSEREALEELIRWIFNFPECDTGWRGDDHEVCHQNLEVYRAEILRTAREHYAALAPTPGATPPPESGALREQAIWFNRAAELRVALEDVVSACRKVIGSASERCTCLAGEFTDQGDDAPLSGLAATTSAAIRTLQRPALPSVTDAPAAAATAAEPVGAQSDAPSRHYRKRPVVVEAVQWTGVNVDEVLAFCFTSASVRDLGPASSSKRQLAIETAEGEMRATPGDWIIKGVKGEFYPCKPDIFAATYEPAAAVPGGSGATDAGEGGAGPTGAAGERKLFCDRCGDELDIAAQFPNAIRLRPLLCLLRP